MRPRTWRTLISEAIPALLLLVAIAPTALACPFCEGGPSGVNEVRDGVINHHILHIHHVTETENHLIWDIAFLVSGVLLIGIGWVFIQAGKGDRTVRGQLADG